MRRHRAVDGAAAGVVLARQRLAHEGVEGLLDAAAEDPVRLARGILKLHDVHAVAEPLAEQLDRIGRRAVVMRRVDADHAGDAVEMAQRHLPDDEAAPVVADEDRLVDLEMIEQPDEIAGQMLHVVGLDRLGPVGRAIAALVRRDHADAGLAQRLDLVTPGKRHLRPAVAEHHRRRVGLRPRLVVAHANTVRLGELQRRHFDHCKIPIQRALVMLGGGAIGRLQRLKLLAAACRTAPAHAE